MSQTPPTRSGANQPLPRFHAAGLALTPLDHGSFTELHLTLTPLPDETWPAACRRLRDVLRDEDAVIAAQMVWGSVLTSDLALSALKREFGGIHWPVTWTEGADLAGRAWSGIQVWAVRGARVEPVEIAGRILACQYRDDTARRVMLGGLGGNDIAAPQTTQAAQTFDQLEATLARVGLDMSHVVRTWFFLDDILSWYDDFNRVRTDFFRSRRVFEGLVPASTGVGTRNPSGATVAAAALAVETFAGTPVVSEIPSPAQCPATSYGSSFSRAVEIRSAACRQVIISGTASIEPGGRSVRPNDLLGQVELTFEVIGDILKSRGLSLADTTRATAYFKTAAGADGFAGWLARRGWQNLPIIPTVAAVCRDELLFELELDAATQRPRA